jgi:superfamily II DNA or RNA helicase
MENATVSRPTAQTLRQYQDECVGAFQEWWSRDNETPLGWLATGGGKTTILSELLVREVKPEHQRALVFAHTQEIIYQIRDRISNQYGELLQPYYGPRFLPGIGVVMGTNDSPDARIVVATRQSLHKKRLERVLESGAFDTVLIDEGHHVAPDNTYTDIIKYLREVNPQVKVGGLTATPKRTDKKGLGVLFSGICYRWTILDGIKGGYLAPATRIKIKTGVDTSGVKSSKGDYDQKQLISVLDAANWVTLAMKAYLEYADERQTLAFFPKVDMSREFVRQLKESGIAAAHIDANTPKDERVDVLSRYQRGELRVVSNMGVLTEGFDAPQTSCILMARPTRSETLFTQIIGRGLRLYPGKADCIVLDLTVVDTKVLEVGTVLGQMADCPKCTTQFWKGLKNCPQCGEDVHEENSNTKQCPKCGEEIPRSARQCPECGYVIPKIVLPPDYKGFGEGLAAEVAELFHALSSAWQPDETGWFSCGVGFDGSALVIAPPSYAANGDRLRERIQKGYALLPDIDPEWREDLLLQIEMLERELRRIEQYTLYYVPPVQKDPATGRDLGADRQWPVAYLRSNGDLASLMNEADSEAKSRGGFASDKAANWRNELASDGQRGYLKRLGGRKLPDDLTKGQAASKITHLISIKRVKTHIADDCLAEIAQESAA